jgi:peptide/nickel transport system substrate-binding protein
MCALNDTLMRWTVTGNQLQYPAPVPNLVSSYKANSRLTQFQFTLKSGRKFASGRPITVDDVVWSLNRLGQTGIGQFLLATVNVNPKNVATKVDDQHFAVTAEGPAGILPQLMAIYNLAILDKTAYMAGTTKKDPWALTWGSTHVAGAGPYVLSANTSGVGQTLTRNPNYVGPRRANFDTVKREVVPAVSDRVALLQKGGVDIAEGLPFSRVTQLAQDPSLRVYHSRSQAFTYLTMNLVSGPFTNHMLREAIAAAIPTDEIIKSVYYGYAEPLKNIVIPRGGVGFDPSVPGFKYDPTKASQLAQQSGVKGLTTQIAYDTTNPEHTEIAAIVQAALAPIGIQATPMPLPPATFQTEFFQHKLPMAVYSGLGYVDDPNYNPEAFWDSKSFADFTGYKNPTVDATLKALHQTSSQAKRILLAHALQRLVQADIPVVPLAQPFVVYAVRKDVGHFVPTPLGLIFYEYETKG